MPVPGVGAVGGVGGMDFTPYVAPRADVGPAGSAARVGGAHRAEGPSGPDGPDFGKLVLDGLDRLEGVQAQSDHLAVQAATGDLQAIHDYTIAATQAQVTTQLTVAVRNKAVEAFTEILRMPV
ncbi:flagellar hook-basal body complex protein FliE [Nocardioides anomalus]|uniref:Flagellar hook-basal body complex protein FliE n=1 Tax=Nocardioides anomalus TaxID=2712223 RepID=A0A6G6WAV8_9ACTN|nr:flagellar hook-basal body complex protein FliE [Nocardioides anomalus]QIG42468.1 flagellar hook-basal body complex protein FliE [Nocardioides anomalus]